jgi:CHASE3 domain sensor protein
VVAKTDPDIITAMRSSYLDDAHGAAKELARQFGRLADFLEDLADIKSDDKSAIEAEILLARAVMIAPNYSKFTRAVDAVRDTTEEE